MLTQCPPRSQAICDLLGAHLIVYLVDHLVESFDGEELDLEVGRSLDVGEDEGVDVHRALVAVELKHALAVGGVPDGGVLLVRLLLLHQFYSQPFIQRLLFPTVTP